ncbi:E3 ubiquitin-protein ligase RNF213-like [Glandiceps talaboti]
MASHSGATPVPDKTDTSVRGHDGSTDETGIQTKAIQIDVLEGSSDSQQGGHHESIDQTAEVDPSSPPEDTDDSIKEQTSAPSTTMGEKTDTDIEIDVLEGSSDTQQGGHHESMDQTAEVASSLLLEDTDVSLKEQASTPSTTMSEKTDTAIQIDVLEGSSDSQQGGHHESIDQTAEVAPRSSPLEDTDISKKEQTSTPSTTMGEKTDTGTANSSDENESYHSCSDEDLFHEKPDGPTAVTTKDVQKAQKLVDKNMSGIDPGSQSTKYEKDGQDIAKDQDKMNKGDVLNDDSWAIIGNQDKWTTPNPQVTAFSTTTVYLRALIHKDISLADEYGNHVPITANIHFKGSKPGMAIFMERKGKREGGHMYCEGKFNVPKNALNEGFGYKYIIDGKAELIYSKRPQMYTYIERWVQMALPQPEYHCYDGTILFDIPKKWPGFFNVKKWRRENTETAMKAMLPKWSGFVVSGGMSMLGGAAVNALYDVVARLNFVRHRKVFSTNRECIKCKHIDVNYRTLVSDFLLPKLQSLENTDSFEEICWPSCMERIISAIGILHVVNYYAIKLTNDELCGLARALSTGRRSKDECSNILKALDENYVVDRCDASRAHIGRLLQRLCNLIIEKGSEDWIHCLPLLHFITRVATPYEFGTIHTEDISTKEWWWGLEGLNDATFTKKNYKYKSKTMIEQLHPLFEMDEYLPRSLVFLVNPNSSAIVAVTKLQKVPSYVVSARILYGVVKNEIKEFNDEVISSLQEIQQHNETTQRRICATHAQSSTTNDEDILITRGSYAIANQLIQSALNGTCCTQKKHLWYLLDYYISESNIGRAKAKKLKIQDKQDDLSIENMESNITIVAVTCWHCLRFLQNDNDTLKMLQEWSTLIEMRELDSELVRPWKCQILVFVRDKLLKSSLEELLQMYLYSEENGIEPLIREKISDTLHSELQTDRKKFKELLVKRFDPKKHPKTAALGSLYTDLIVRELQGTSSIAKKDLISRILHDKLWCMFIQIFGEARKSLSEEGKQCLDKVGDCIRSVADDVKSGDIEAEVIKLLENEKTQFEVLWRFISQSRGLNPDEEVKCLQESLKLREKERKSLLDFDQFLDNLNNILKGLKTKVNSKDLCNAISILQKEDIPLSRLCVTTTLEEIRKTRIPYIGQAPVQIRANALGLSVSALEMIQETPISILGRKIWEKIDGELAISREDPITVDVLSAEIWPVVKQAINAVSAHVMDYQMPLHDVCTYFKTYRQYPGQLIKDLVTLPALFSKRTAAIEFEKRVMEYFGLEETKDVAEKISKCVHVLGLKGDFSALDTIFQMGKVLENKVLGDVNEDVISASKLLRGFTEKQLACLKALTECQDVITWSLANMKDSTEVNNFTTLLLMSVGESEIDMGKVTTYQEAMNGYSCLLFELPKLPKPGWSEFNGMCSTYLWTELDRDPKLPNKLKDSKNHLDWFKTLKDVHGPTEIKCIEQMEIVNSIGFYQVGNLKGKGKNTEEFIRLYLLQDETIPEGMPKEWTLNDLNDLRSKLILVSGTAHVGKEALERFLETLEGVTRTHDGYKSLLHAGDLFFDDFLAEVFAMPPAREDKTKATGAASSVSRTYSLKLDLGDKEAFQGRDDPLKHLPHLCKFLEHCVLQWHAVVQRARAKFQVLNNFTVKQINIMRQQLVCFLPGYKGNIKPSDELFTLLQGIDVVREAETLRKMVHGCFQSVKEDPSILLAQTTSANDCDPKKLQAFLNCMDEHCQATDKVAKAAFQACEGDIEKGQMWCIEHMEDDDEEVNQCYADFKKTPYADIEDLATGSDLSEATRKVETPQATDEASQPHYESSPVRQLQQSWKNYQKNISLDADCKHVSIEFLGLVLNNLMKEFEVRETTQTQKVPMDVKVGRPNLFVVQEGLVLKACLSLFFDGEQLMLPDAGEVLICAHDTTIEEVTLFWRRAILGSKQGKLYSMVHADRLSYNVAKGSYDTFLALSQGKSGYRIAIICSQENESHFITTAFDNYRMRLSKIMTDGELQKHLKEYLVVKDTNSAAACDRESMCMRVVTTTFPGNGKSLYVKGLCKRLQRKVNERDTNVHANEEDLYLKIPLHGKILQSDRVAASMLERRKDRKGDLPMIYHIDIYPSVTKGIDEFLFNLVVLQQITDSNDYVWKRRNSDLYVIEISSPSQDDSSMTPFCSCLPTIIRASPKEVYEYLKEQPPGSFQQDIFDTEEFCSEEFQRVAYYLSFYQRDNIPDAHYDTKSKKLERLADYMDFLKLLLRYSGVEDPSWSVVRQFVTFLNIQLKNWESSPFCGKVTSDVLPGFGLFVLKFIIIVAQDFGTPSLTLSDESIDKNLREASGGLYHMRRKWEEMAHPYIFFNKDGSTMTFHGFEVRRDGTLRSPTNPDLSVKDITMKRNLQGALKLNKVNLSENFDTLKRDAKVKHMCTVLGLDAPNDPDEEYELTSDSVTKMLAIMMRFRSNIPVIIMGETGCGKTRLVKYLCEMMVGGRKKENIKNFLVMKVHGGTTVSDIEKKVKEAELLAKQNDKAEADRLAKLREEMAKTRAKIKDEKVKKEVEMHDEEAIRLATITGHVDTVLFFDEANTTEALGLIKELLADRTLNGRPLASESLKFVVACNPYRKHSLAAIRSLEAAGLGFRVNTAETHEKLGTVPLRHLVYRVQSLPPRLLGYVWDFGTLSNDVELSYITSIVKNSLVPKEGSTENKYFKSAVPLLIEVISASHKFMKKQKDECRFVSLRDIERVVTVFKWFSDHYHIFGDKDGDGTGISENKQIQRCVILTMGVCYHASLKNREEYRRCISSAFVKPYSLPTGRGSEAINCEIARCQDIFVNSIKLNANIAKNEALKENIFMLTLCIELKIPVFLVGKPGSSKSLGKTIVDNAMKGSASSSELFKKFKRVQMWSCQCSQHSTPENIIETFKHCAAFQKQQYSSPDYKCLKEDIEQKIGVVVLDEVGLAEDSPLMPLKTLHPLLETGRVEEDHLPPPIWLKVGFIGLSNWALDPAKMNRGIFVVRDVPNKDELVSSARGILGSDSRPDLQLLERLISPMSEAYLRLLKECEDREYFGLRDFYGLVKMVYNVSNKQGRTPTWGELKHCVCRNFSGHSEVNAVDIFEVKCKDYCEKEVEMGTPESECSPLALICSNLSSKGSTGETRYLLLMTKNNAAYDILKHIKTNDQEYIMDPDNTLIIYGSHFENDQEYTQVCRNIKRIKLCMETGHPVLLINAENLYESLYDMMNQYYIEFGDLRFVNLGLGTHRFNARVHHNFRLIVIAERETVMKTYPIPLINRLEKHYIVLNHVLTTEQQSTRKDILEWVGMFISYRSQRNHTYTAEGAFIGYHDDAVPTIVHDMYLATEEKQCGPERHNEQVLQSVKTTLQQACTPDAIIRLGDSVLPDNISTDIRQTYFKEHFYDGIQGFLDSVLQHDTELVDGILYQITTHGKLLTEYTDITPLTKIEDGNVHLVNLQQFGSEEEFRKVIRDFNGKCKDKPNVLVIQCAVGTLSTNALFDGKTEERHHSFGVAAVLRMCIHCAINMIEWDQQLVKRCRDNITESQITDHIRILQTLTDDEFHSRTGQNPFNAVLKKRIYLVLKELEERSVDSTLNWANEAAFSAENLQEGGTFRRTLVLKICRLVTPVLALILGSTCSNNNLKVLFNNSIGTWIHTLWLKMLATETITPLPTDIPSLDERLMLHHKGPNGLVEFKIPFSWCVFNVLEEQYDRARAVQRSESHSKRLGQTLCSILNTMPLGKVLQGTVNENWTAFYDKYLHDFIQQTYKWNSVEEFEHVRQAFLAAVIEHRNQHEKSLDRKEPASKTEDLCIGDIHVVYTIIKRRLQCFSDLVCAFPEILEKLNTAEMPKEEMVLDAVALDCALDVISPTAEKLKDATFRQRWLHEHLPCVNIVANQLLKFYSKEYGPESMKLIDQCKPRWSALKMIQLFVEHRSSSDKDEADYLTVMPYFGVLKKKESSKKDHMTKIERLMTTCNRNAAKRYFSKGVAHCACGNHDIIDPVVLECGHLCNKQCFEKIKSAPKEEFRCPLEECKKVFTEGFQATPSVEGRKEVEEYKIYRRRCNLFFLELVTSYYLYNEEGEGRGEPDSDVLEKLFHFITTKGEQLSSNPFKDCSVDTTPVVRTFLLRHLLNYRTKDVRQKLQDYLDNYWKLGESDSGYQVGLLMLYVQCVEDSLLKQECQVNVKIIAEEAMQEFLRHTGCYQTQNIAVHKVEYLHNISSLRFALTVLGDSIHEQKCGRVSRKRAIHLSEIIKALSEQGREIAETIESPHCNIFLLKYLCRRYGLAYLDDAQKEKDMHWLLPKSSQPVLPKTAKCVVCNGDDHEERAMENGVVALMKCHICFEVAHPECLKSKGITKEGVINEDLANSWKCPKCCEGSSNSDSDKISAGLDWLVILGSLYVRMKAEVKELSSEQGGTISRKSSTNQIISLLKDGTETNEVKQISLLLAIYNEITLAYGQTKMADQSSITRVEDVVKKTQVLNQEGRKMALNLLKNEQGSPTTILMISDEMSKSDKQVITFLTHFNAVMTVRGKKDLFTPFKMLMVAPTDMLKSYLPTMPDKYLCDRQEEEGCWLTCSNGHPYFKSIDCSQNAQKVCRTCSIKLLSNDSKFRERDKHTFTGHLLTGPSNRGTETPYPVRDILHIPVAVLRLLTHAAMLFGSIEHAEVISKMINLQNNYDVKVESVPIFLLRHIKQDATMLSKAIGGSIDDALLTMHLILQKGFNVTHNLADPLLKSEEARAKFEELVTDNLINPMILELDTRLEEAVHLTLKDAGLDKNETLRAIYELDEMAPDINQPPHMIPALWNYRSKFSLEQLGRLLQQNQKDRLSQYPVLYEFLRMERWLRALKFLPDIVELQIRLRRMFNLHLSIQEAEDKTIGRFLMEHGEHRHLVDCFCKAWSLLSNGMFSEGLGGIEIPAKFRIDKIDIQRENITMLLPSTSGRGVCSLALVDALVSAHNIFVRKYAHIRNFEKRLNESEKINVTDVTLAHLIAYNPVDDLEPLVASHCDYSLEIGAHKGTQQDYDFPALERQIITRFIQGKPLIQRETILMVYSDSICDKFAFASLRRLIPQTKISPGTQNEIESQFQASVRLPDLCTSLRAVNLAIGFLKSCGEEKDMPLNTYLEDTLRLPAEDGILSDKAKKSCTLSHTLSLWQILAVAKAKHSLKGNLDPFNDVSHRFKEDIPNDVKPSLSSVLPRIDVNALMKEIFEFIKLELIKGRKTDIDPNQPLTATLEEFYLSKFSKSTDGTTDLKKLPCQLLVKHIVKVWHVLHEHHTDIQNAESRS